MNVIIPDVRRSHARESRHDSLDIAGRRCATDESMWVSICRLIRKRRNIRILTAGNPRARYETVIGREAGRIITDLSARFAEGGAQPSPE